jgi:hypothetical protein
MLKIDHTFPIKCQEKNIILPVVDNRSSPDTSDAEVGITNLFFV